MIERRSESTGRRIEDTQGHCLDHSGLVTDVGIIKDTVKDHSTKLGKFFSRINATLISILLTLLVVAIDVIVRLAQS